MFYESYIRKPTLQSMEDAVTIRIIETSHYLTTREPDGDVYCMRCGLYNPCDEDSCVPMRYEAAESSEKAA
jgi:hypothetical protein